MIEKAIFVRCMKHYLRETFRTAPASYLPNKIAHVLNCILVSEK